MAMMMASTISRNECYPDPTDGGRPDPHEIVCFPEPDPGPDAWDEMSSFISEEDDDGRHDEIHVPWAPGLIPEPNYDSDGIRDIMIAMGPESDSTYPEPEGPGGTSDPANYTEDPSMSDWYVSAM